MPKLSSAAKRLLFILGMVIVLLAVFSAGVFVGSRRARFSYEWGENYFRNFAGPHREFFGDFDDRDYLMSSGVFGSIIKTASSSLVVQDPRDNAEKIILITPQTIIRKMRTAVSAGDLEENDQVIVIGSPTSSGQIEAKIIRVFPSSTAPF